MCTSPYLAASFAAMPEKLPVTTYSAVRLPRKLSGTAENCVVAPPWRKSTSCVSGTSSRRLKRSLASACISAN